MAVLQPNEHVDVSELEFFTGREGLALASEEELRRHFPECELGAMPPFGNLYGLTMYVDPCLAQDEICFQSGNHREIVRMPYQAFARLAKPSMGGACLHREPSHAG